MKVFFTGCSQKIRERKKRKPNDSKELNHPVDILGFHLGGPPPLCFALLTHSVCMERC